MTQQSSRSRFLGQLSTAYGQCFVLLLLSVICTIAALLTGLVNERSGGGGGDFPIVQHVDGTIDISDGNWPPLSQQIGRLHVWHSTTSAAGPMGFRDLFRGQAIELSYQPSALDRTLSPAEFDSLRGKMLTRLASYELNQSSPDKDYLGMLASGKTDQRWLRPEMLPAMIARVLAVLCVLGFVGMCIRIRTLRKKLWRVTERKCARCGYSLKGLSVNRCPECGCVS